MSAFRFVVRASFILLVGCLSLARYGLARLGIALTSPLTRSDAEVESAVAALRGRVLRRALETLGATFIKLGQVMSTRPDLLAPEIIAELRHLQDRLPAFPGAREVIERELGPPWRDAFEELDERPIAAASVAQVHRGVLAGEHRGTEVAVKVLRPDVRATAEQDGRILLALARVLERVSDRAQHAQLVEHLEHLVEGILEQTDLRIEAANYARFHQNFRRTKGIRFPRVFEDLSGERIMTMEFVRGVKVDAIARSELPEDLPRRLREAFLKMCFDDGFLHADLHPGNFLVESDGTVAIFDVGLVKQLSDEMLGHYIDFNRCLVMGDVADLMRHLRTYHSYVEGTVDWAELERDIARFHGQFRKMSARDLEFGTLIDEIFSVGRKHGVRPVTEMTLMMVGLVTAEGIGKQLEPTSDSFGEVARYLMPILARRGMLPAAA